MGIFTSMKASHAMNYIKGISPGMRMSMGVGAAAGGLYGGTGRRGSLGKAAGYGLAGGALAAAGAAGYSAMGGRVGMGMMAPECYA
jgi:hypothetical protein